jgi:hypothetical protein
LKAKKQRLLSVPGADGSVKNLAIPNWDAINAKRQALTEIWNRQVAGK